MSKHVDEEALTRKRREEFRAQLERKLFPLPADPLDEEEIAWREMIRSCTPHPTEMHVYREEFSNRGNNMGYCFCGTTKAAHRRKNCRGYEERSGTCTINVLTGEELPICNNCYSFEWTHRAVWMW